MQQVRFKQDTAFFYKDEVAELTTDENRAVFKGLDRVVSIPIEQLKEVDYVEEYYA